MYQTEFTALNYVEELLKKKKKMITLYFCNLVYLWKKIEKN